MNLLPEKTNIFLTFVCLSGGERVEEGVVTRVFLFSIFFILHFLSHFETSQSHFVSQVEVHIYTMKYTFTPDFSMGNC